jgi:aminopeptidase N
MVTFPILARPLSIVACLFRSFLLVLFAGHASAEQPFSFATTPGQLPKTVMPVLYALDLTPDLDKLSFTGTEIVDIDVAAPATNRLVLNAVFNRRRHSAVNGAHSRSRR